MKNTPSFLQYVECYAIFLEGMTSRMSTCIYTCNTAAHTYIFIIVVLPTATLFYIVLADLKMLKYGIASGLSTGYTNSAHWRVRLNTIHFKRLIIGIIDTFL